MKAYAVWNSLEGIDAHCHIFNLSYALRAIMEANTGSLGYQYQGNTSYPST